MSVTSCSQAVHPDGYDIPTAGLPESTDLFDFSLRWGCPPGGSGGGRGSSKPTVKSHSPKPGYTCQAFPYAGEIMPQAMACPRPNDRKIIYMKKWEYRLLVALWDHDKGRFYWADNERDQRNSQERLEALAQEGWETVSSFPCGVQVKQQNYLLRRPVTEILC